MKKRTPGEVEELKAKWLEQPYWVLENTEGFEAYRDDLRQFRLDAHARHEQDRLARLVEFINQYEAGNRNKWAESPESLVSRSDTREVLGGGNEKS